MRIISWRDKLYGLSSIALAVPVFRKVEQEQGAHGDESETATYAGNTTTTWMLTIPWVNVQKIETDPAKVPQYFL